MHLKTAELHCQTANNKETQSDPIEDLKENINRTHSKNAHLHN
jgi:hypothetical protein